MAGEFFAHCFYYDIGKNERIYVCIPGFFFFRPHGSQAGKKGSQPQSPDNKKTNKKILQETCIRHTYTWQSTQKNLSAHDDATIIGTSRTYFLFI